MELRSLDLAPYYRTGANDLVSDFYRPCLSVAQRYDRAVGYFTSSSLAAAASGLMPFIARDQTMMRLVASPALTDEDADAIRAGYELREVIENAIRRELEVDIPDATSQRLELLTWLIAHNRLEIKLAVVWDKGRTGIYHEKLGIFYDTRDSVVFTGSANESASGLLANFESIEVFRSWVDGEGDRVERRIVDFENLWSNSTKGLDVLEFPEACRRQLLQRYASTAGGSFTRLPDVDTEASKCIDDEMLKLPPSIELRDYQKDAIRSWWENNGRGILEMATGTGKTITALTAASAVWEACREEDKSLLVIITAPYKHLAEQWADEVRRFGADPIVAYDSAAKWAAEFDLAIAGASYGRGRLVVVIAVNRTFCGLDFQSRLGLANCTKMFIADEVHTTGSTVMRSLLPDSMTFRLGLSATPDRYMDSDGTDALRNYFGPTTYRLGLKDAISIGALVPYRYYPIVIELTDDEHAEYVELTEKISKLVGPSRDLDFDDPPPALDLLLFRRSRLIGSATNKVPALRKVIERFKNESHMLVYCADRVGDDPQLDQVLRMLGRDLGMRVNTFTADEDQALRSTRLNRFASGDLQALVAMRCLDEGVDVPATRRAFILASSQNPRQFIQRRGRVLRKAPGKTEAEIYDFIVSPPDFTDDPALYEVERRLVGKELVRAAELCDAALNPIEALSVLRPLRVRYDLLSMTAPVPNE